MSRVWLTSAIVGVLLATVVAAAVLVVGDDGSSDGRPEDGSAGATPGSPATVSSSDVLTLADAGRKLTFHAVYEAGALPDPVGLPSITVELWRDQGWTRQDTTTRDDPRQLLRAPAGGSRLTVSVRGPDGIRTLCIEQRRPAGLTWNCSEQRSDVDGDLFAARAADLVAGGVDMTVTSTTIAGHEAVCFAPAATSASELRPRIREICYRSDGIPVRLSMRDTSLFLEIVQLDLEVDRDVFTLPNEIRQGVAGPWLRNRSSTGVAEHAQKHGVGSVINHAKIPQDNVASRGVGLRLGRRVVGELDDRHGLHDPWARSWASRASVLREIAPTGHSTHRHNQTPRPPLSCVEPGSRGFAHLARWGSRA